MKPKIRFGPEFWISAIRTFRHERGPHGEPSIDDFKEFDLPTIKRRFSDRNQLKPWYNHPNYRSEYIYGKVAYVYYVVGQIEPEGVIRLISLDVDLEFPDHPED